MIASKGSLPDSWFNSFFAYLIVFSIGLVVIGTEFASGSRLANISSRLEAINGVNVQQFMVVNGLASIYERFADHCPWAK